MSKLTVSFTHNSAMDKYLTFLDSPITEFEACYKVHPTSIEITADDLSIDKLQDTVCMELDICALEMGIDYNLFL